MEPLHINHTTFQSLSDLLSVQWKRGVRNSLIRVFYFRVKYLTVSIIVKDNDVLIRIDE
jgi:hypothetical protein